MPILALVLIDQARAKKIGELTASSRKSTLSANKDTAPMDNATANSMPK